MDTTQKRALIVGASGIVGSNLAHHLSGQPDWTVYGLARRPDSQQGVHPIAADLLNLESLQVALSDVRPTHIFYASWLRNDTEAENIRVNGGMVRNLLTAVASGGTVQHVALVTGLKHYLGPFESYGKGKLPATPFREDQERLAIENFYYAQEDEVFAAAQRNGFFWSVHRPHTIVGFAVGNAMNIGATLAVYASICRETGRPFVFPGSAVQWKSLTDMTDARLLAKHLQWASESPAARNEAFNIVNGDIFRWNWMWGRLAEWFGIEAAPFPDEPAPLQMQLADAAPIWRDIAQKHNLAEPDMARLVSAWHTDADLGRPIEVLTDMSKSRRLGFLEYQATEESFCDLFATMRSARLIP